MKLGRIPSGPTPHLPSLGLYAATMPLPEPPAVVDWGRECGDWPLLANDVVGDCAVAALLHYIQAATRWRDGAPLRATTLNALSGYRAMGWDGQGEGPGCSLAALVSRWQADGFSFGWAPHTDTISGFARVELEHLKAALWLFGPLLLGVELPRSAAHDGAWLTPGSLTGDNAPGSWGGHAVLLTALDDHGTATLVTWGAERAAEIGWIEAYFGEAWAVLHPAWVALDHSSPAGWDITVLQTNLRRVGNG